MNQPGWGELAEEWWTFYATREWEAGGFAWTGFDYRGEPTPYGWPSINSQFGIVDTCGFPKDSFFYYKAWWTQGACAASLPALELGGQGRRRDSRVGTLQPRRSGAVRQRQERGPAKGSAPRARGVEGALRAGRRSRRADGRTAGSLLTEKRETTGPIAALRLTADRTAIDADGEDVAVLTVEALDSAGRAVPTASNLVHFKVAGEGALIGVGNGDPNCQESDKEPRRSLFNGLAQAIVQSTKTAGTIAIEAGATVRGSTVAPAKIEIATRQVEQRPAVG